MIFSQSELSGGVGHPGSVIHWSSGVGHPGRSSGVGHPEEVGHPGSVIRSSGVGNPRLVIHEVGLFDGGEAHLWLVRCDCWWTRVPVVFSSIWAIVHIAL